jgi:hypothetical protein
MEANNTTNISLRYYNRFVFLAVVASIIFVRSTMVRLARQDVDVYRSDP